MFGASPAAALWWANEIRIWAAALAAIAAVASWVASYYQIRLANQVGAEKDRAFDEYRTAAEERTARAQADAAIAQERAASLEKQAADARLKQEEMRQSLSWRALTPSASDALVAALNRPGKVVLAYTANDPEAISYASHFRQALTRAGWTVNAQAWSYPDRVLFGLFVPFKAGSQNVGPLQSAFQAAGLAFSSEFVPAPVMMMGAINEATEEYALIFVGSKRQSF